MLRSRLNRQIVEYIKNKWNIELTEHKFTPLSGEIIAQVLKYQEIKPGSNYYSIHNIAQSWFHLTNMKNKLEDHSVHSFASYLDKQYYILPIDKKRMTSKLKYWLLKLIFEKL